MSFDQYSTTPASNDLLNYFQTGMRPSAVKTAGWDIMADLASLFSLPTSTGTANAQAIANGRPYASLVAGLVRGSFIPGFTNTGAMTLAIDGLTAKNVYANGAPIIAGMVVSGVLCHYVYDGTNVVILNPQRSTGSFTVTLNGMTSTVTGTLNFAIEPSGKLASMWAASAILGTSNATTMSLLNVPAIIQPATTKRVAQPLEDNSTSFQNGVIFASASSTFACNSNFTASGQKGIPAGWAGQWGLD